MSAVTEAEPADITEQLFGISRSAFLEQFYGRDPLLSLRPIDPAILMSLPDVASFAETVALHSEQPGSIKIAQNSRAMPSPLLADGRLDLHAVWSSFDQGCSVILNNLYKIDRGTKAVAEQISLSFGHHAQANAYLTPPQSTAFQTHYDTHDVIIVQVAGSKNWRIHEASSAVPEFPSEHAAPLVEPAILERGNFVDIHLEKGHALYVPRGRPHRVGTGDEASLHITFGLRPITIADLLRIAVDFAEKQCPALRRHVGVDLLADPGFCADIHSGISLLETTAASTSLPNLVTQAARKQLLKQVNLAPAVLFPQGTVVQAVRWRNHSYSEWREEPGGDVVISNGIKAARFEPHEADIAAQLRSGKAVRLDTHTAVPKAIRDLLALGLVVPDAPSSDG